MAGDRKFYMAKGSTYIETQKNYIRGNQIIGDTAKGLDDESEKDEVEKDTESQPTTIEQLDEAFMMAVNIMAKQGDIKWKYDFGAIKQIIDEKRIYQKFTHDNMIERLNRCDVPGNLMPSKASLKVLNFGNTPHPNWKIMEMDPDETKRIINLAGDFLDLFKTFLQ